MTAQLPSRERLQEIIDVDARCNPEVRALARFALAAYEQEPVAVSDEELNAALALHRLKVDGHSQLSDAFRAGFRYARRTHPAPSIPAVLDELMHHDKDPEITKAYKIGWNARRAAMLNGGKS